MAQHLSIDEFFIRLFSLFESQRQADHGSIFLTQKRLYPTDPSCLPSPIPPLTEAPFADLSSASPLSVLIRATNGSSKEHRAHKVKLSTVVEADKLEAFFARYSEVCKAGMQGLKKRDRSGRKNKAKAKKRKEGMGEVERRDR